jgi:hypothetical protein
VILVPLESADGLCDLFITLQRGWAGPRFDADAYGTDDLSFRVTLAGDGNTLMTSQDDDIDTPAALAWGTANWVMLDQTGDTVRLGITMAVVQEGVPMALGTDSYAYGESRETGAILSASGYLRVDTQLFASNSGATLAAALGLERLTDARVVPLIAKRQGR